MYEESRGRAKRVFVCDLGSGCHPGITTTRERSRGENFFWEQRLRSWATLSASPGLALGFLLFRTVGTLVGPACADQPRSRRCNQQIGFLKSIYILG